jgi:hypothetical protein
MRTKISTVFRLVINDLFSLKTDVNVPTVSNKQKNLLFVGILKVTDEQGRIQIRNQLYGSKDPEPSQNVTDPKHWKIVLIMLPLSLSLLAKFQTTVVPLTSACSACQREKV